MRTIRARDPGLWQEIVDSLTGDVSLPSEQEAAQERARQKAAGAILTLFQRQDGLRTGRKRLNTTALLVIASLAIIAVTFISQSGTGDRRRPPATVGHVGPQVRAEPTPPSATSSPSPPPMVTPQPPTVPQGGSSGVNRPVVADLTAQMPSLPMPPEAPPVPSVPNSPDTTAGQRPLASPVLYRSPERPTQQPRSPVLHRLRRDSEPGQQAQNVMFRAENQAQASHTAGTALLYSARRERQQQTDARADRNLPPEAAQNSQPDAVATLHPGQVLQARLALPVSVSPAWGPVPALAEVLDGPLAGSALWGQARMARDGSIEISFTQVLMAGNRSLPFNGTAYDPASGRPAVSGQVRTLTPNALQTVLSSSLQAASEYFRARVESQSVTITNGFITVQQREPNFWDVYSRELARAMTPQTPQGSGPVVVAHLPRGTPISVIVMSEFSSR